MKAENVSVIKATQDQTAAKISAKTNATAMVTAHLKESAAAKKDTSE